MASDTSSLKQTGGLGPEPKTFRPSDFITEPAMPAGVVVGAKSPKKLAAVIAGVVAFLALAGGVTYFFLLPLFTGEEEVEAPVVTPPPAEMPGPALVHQSYFSEAPDATEAVGVSALTQAELTAVLEASAATQTSGTIKEVALTAGGNPVSAGDFLALMLPGSNLSASLEQDFTAFIYRDANGNWPGYVFKLKSDSDLVAAKTEVALIESSANLSSFYLVSPGTPSATGFKDGKANSVTTRYLAYFNAGASFNYGWSGDYLILSTSYNGFVKAAGLLE
ncbi:MAG: hypothetical protein HYS89_01820 [Candidatus Colwellbacteria bacterium]|nr:hypothetical protein [Candidatus Colwellbacteria bacterium]